MIYIGGYFLWVTVLTCGTVLGRSVLFASRGSDGVLPHKRLHVRLFRLTRDLFHLKRLAILSNDLLYQSYTFCDVAMAKLHCLNMAGTDSRCHNFSDFLPVRRYSCME